MKRLALLGMLVTAAACGGSEDPPSPICGDGVREGSEECDDGNTASGDGCSATCDDEIVLPVCGNEIVEGTEECDDGNTDPGDGCDESCLDEGGPPDAGPDAAGALCGNGVREGSEECDDGNTASGDGCSAACTSETVGPACGDGFLDPGEQCDDGNTASGDGCSATCQLEAGACGDGVLNSGEQCDDGNLLPGDGCDAACQLEGAICGDGLVDAGEQCDDGNTLDGDGCSALCRIEVCGDGVVNGTEECDDGNTVDGDGCSDFCLLEIMPGCGNGVLEPGEECDDGNTAAGDGCDAACLLEATGACEPDWELACGDADSWSTTYSGATDRVDAYSCIGWDESGPEYTYTFVATTASDVTVELSGLAADLDVFVLAAGGGGACDADGCLAHGDASATFTSVPGTTYYVVVDGYLGASSVYSINLTCGVCGDGNLDPSEECDDGNTASADGCSPACLLEGCGNGTLDPGEECDEGDTNDCDGCSAACRDEGCGNFVVECSEECDDGDTTSGDGCSSSCAFEAGECAFGFELLCGAEDTYATDFGGSTDAIDYYSCTSWNESGREYAYRFYAATSGEVTVTLTGLSADLDVFVIAESPGGLCSSEDCVAFGNLSATFTALAGTVYYFVVDGYLGAVGDYTLEVSCGGGICGDGVINAGEQCDDGNVATGDGCDDLCLFEYCGDGSLQIGLGEECDDGNNLGGDGCSALCQSEAGACLPDLTLGCGAVDTWNTTGAGSTDQVNGYSCVTWDESGPEYAYEVISAVGGGMTATLSGLAPGVDLDVFVVADDGDGACDPAANCVEAGDTTVTWFGDPGERFFVVVDGFMGDAGAYTLSLTCVPSSTCGNAVLESYEECDDGNFTDLDGCSDCLIDGGSCTADWNLGCDDTDTWSTSGSGSTDLVDEYACAAWDESGREYTYSFETDAHRIVDVFLYPEMGVDLDVFVVTDAGFGCAAGNCINSGDSVINFEAFPGARYYIVVEGFAGDEGSYFIYTECSGPLP